MNQLHSQSEPRLSEPQLPEPRLPEPRLPEPRLPEPRLPEPRLPEPRLPEPRLPEPRLPEPRLPEPRLPEPRLPEQGAIKGILLLRKNTRKVEITRCISTVLECIILFIYVHKGRMFVIVIVLCVHLYYIHVYGYINILF